MLSIEKTPIKAERQGDKFVAYQISDFCAKHLFILEILSFQAVNMTLHLK